VAMIDQLPFRRPFMVWKSMKSSTSGSVYLCFIANKVHGDQRLQNF
jgi:hypothetical protein